MPGARGRPTVAIGASPRGESQCERRPGSGESDRHENIVSSRHLAPGRSHAVTARRAPRRRARRAAHHLGEDSRLHRAGRRVVRRRARRADAARPTFPARFSRAWATRSGSSRWWWASGPSSASSSPSPAEPSSCRACSSRRSGKAARLGDAAVGLPHRAAGVLPGRARAAGAGALHGDAPDGHADAAAGHPARRGAFGVSRLRAAAPRSARGHRAARRGHGAHALLLARRRPSRRAGGRSALRPLHQPAGGRGRRARWRTS